MQQLINVQTVIKSAALISTRGAIAIPCALSYAGEWAGVKDGGGVEEWGEGYRDGYGRY